VTDAIRLKAPNHLRYSAISMTHHACSGGTYQADGDGLVIVRPDYFWDSSQKVWVQKNQTHQDAAFLINTHGFTVAPEV
jgi:hypothetical protein